MVQEVSTKSWGSRIGGALFGVLIGIALIIGSFVLIFWNEGQGLHTSQSLQQTQQVLITVPASPINAANNMKVVYFTGDATTDETLTDPLVGFSTTAIRINRDVEMYQWQQEEETTTEKQLGGSEKETKTYSYKLVWSDEWIDSSNFKDPTGHQNPARMQFKSSSFQAKVVTVGDFHLPRDLINKISEKTSVDLSSVDLSNIQDKTKLTVQHDDESIYIGDDPQNPKVGDIRLNLSQVLPQTVSVIAQQTGNTVQAYQAPAGKSIALLNSGEESAQAMIQDAQRENQIMTWVLRGVSLLMMIIGISLLLGPIAVLADVIPILGSIVNFGTGLISFIVGLLLWAVATAMAWFVVRPLYAIGLVVVVVIVCYLLIKRKK